MKKSITEKNVPTNPSLWNKWKNKAKSKFDVYPSAYANAWAAKMYKSEGGTWKVQKESVTEDKSTKLTNIMESIIDDIIDNSRCIYCGNVVNEDLRDWFKEKWVNIGKKKKDGSHPECGTSGDDRSYAKCVPKRKANTMTKKEKESAVRRKRAAQNKAGRGGKKSKGQGRTPIYVSTD
jgi:hypothetical protein